MRRFKVDGVECLKCKSTEGIISDYDSIETTEDFKITPLICIKCQSHWKDFEGVGNATSNIISIQRQENNS